MFDSLESYLHRVRMLAVDPEAIRGAVKHEAQGDWRGKEHSPEIDAFLLKVIDDIARHSEVVVERVEIEAIGYASFISAFVALRDPVFQAQVLEQSGYSEGCMVLKVLLCRLAPVACIFRPSYLGQNSRSLPSRGEYMTAEHIEWRELGEKIATILARDEVVVLPPEVLDQEIDPELEIDTNLGERPFRVFDAWFHWSD